MIFAGRLLAFQVSDVLLSVERPFEGAFGIVEPKQSSHILTLGVRGNSSAPKTVLRVEATSLIDRVSVGITSEVQELLEKEAREWKQLWT